MGIVRRFDLYFKQFKTLNIDLLRQKDNNCSETCPQSVTIHCEGKVWQTATSTKILCSPPFCVIHSDPLNVRTTGRLFFFSCDISFRFSWRQLFAKSHHQNIMGTWREYFHDKTISKGFFETQKYAFKQNCRNCFKTIRIRDETYKLKSKLTLSSSGLIHFHPTSLSWGKYYLRRLIDGCAGL